MLLRDPDALRDLAAELLALGSFALDTEFVREKYYRPQLCLIQVATREKSVLIDPIALPDLAPLVAVLADPSVEKIAHSGEQDMEGFFAAYDVVPRTVFDTQVAAALAGIGQQISYARLVETLTGVRIDKAETFTDWARRPLSARQLEYALDDVRHLYSLYDALRARLVALGRLEWLADELRSYEDRATYEKDPRDLYRKVKGASRLEPPQLAALRELAAWREKEAQSANRPRGRILRDELLVEIARRAPDDIESIAAVRGIHPGIVRRHGAAILRAVREARRLEPSAYPPPIVHAAEDEELARVVDLLEVVLRERAAEASIAPSYLGTRKDLEQLARSRLRAGEPAGEKPPAILDGWRGRLVGNALCALLEGRSHLAVDPDAGRVKVVAP
jgi:ribonuclease D